MSTAKQIAILGMGNVGGTLGRLWAGQHHSVRFGVPDPHKSSRDVPSETRVTTNREAVAGADVVVLTVPWPAAQEAITMAGSLNGKILIDCTNPLAPDLKGLVLGTNTSAAEMVASWAPEARVVKAFNTIGAACYGKAQFGSETADGFYCGDDPEAKKLTYQLVSEIGLNPVDVGPLTNARLLESLALLWIDLAVNQGQGPQHGFKLLRR